MEDNPNPKQKTTGKSQKKNIEKGDDKLFLLGNINSNVNVFSQLSNMYQTQDEDTTSVSSASSDQSKKAESRKDPVYQAFLQSQKSFDFETNKILGMLNKKSDTTKLRALGELKAMLTQRDEEFYKTFFSTWLYIYKQLVTSEFDKKILEECNQILLIMTPKLKKSLAPFIKELFPLWFFCMNDPNTEVSQIATKAFEQTFPEEKRASVLAFCQDNLIAHILNTCKLTKEKIIEENNSLEDAQIDEVYDRNIISALNSVSAALKLNVKQADPSIFKNKIIELFSLDQPLKGNSILLGFLHNKKRPRIRGGAIELIHSLFSNLDTQVFEKNISELTTMLLDMLDDKERSVQRALWKGCLLTVMRTATNDKTACEKIELKKYENKVLYAVKTAASGLGSLFYDRLVEFFSYLESFSAKNLKNVFDKVEDRVAFYNKFFNHLLQGYNHEEVRSFGEELTNSYYECALFCIIKRIIPLALEAKSASKNYEGNLNSIRHFIKELLIIPCQDYLKRYIKGTALSPYKAIPTRLADVLSHIDIQPDLTEDNIFRGFEKQFVGLFENNTKTPGELDNYFSLLQSALRINQTSALYSYVQELIQKCNSHFQSELKASFLTPEAVVTDSLLESKFEELQKMEKFNAIFVFDVAAAAKNPAYFSLIQENFGNLVDLTIKFLANFDKIMKVLNIEKFAQFTIKTITNILFLYFKARETLGPQSALEDKLSQLLTCLSQNLTPHPMLGLNIHNLILISFLFNPANADNYFSEFVSYNNNKTSEDALLQRTFDTYTKLARDDKSFYFSQLDHPGLQNLLADFVTKVLNSDKYRMFAPSICHSLLFSAQESTVSQAIKSIAGLLNTLATNKGKLSIEFDKLDPLFSSLVILIKTRPLEKISIEEVQPCFVNLIKILVDLYAGSGTSRKRALVIYGILKKVPAGERLPAKSNLKGLRDFIINCLHDAVLNQLEVNLGNKKEGKTKLKLENLGRMVEDYLKFVLFAGNNEHVKQFYQELLNERFFQHSMVVPDVWKVLMTCFETSHSEHDTKNIFAAIRENNQLNPKFFWLLIEMISVVNADSLLSNIKEKKFFTTLSNDFFIQELLNEMESTQEANITKVLEFLDYALTKSLDKSLIYTLGMKKLLKTHIAGSKDSELIAKIFDQLLVKNLKVIASEVTQAQLDSATLFKRAIVHKNLLSVFEKFVPENQEKWAQASKTFQENIQTIIQNKAQAQDPSVLTRFLINLDVFGSMVALNPKLMVEDELLDEIIKYIFTNIKVEALKENKLEPNFTLNTLFEFINLVIETKTFTPLSDNIIQIEGFFLFGLEHNHTPRNYSSTALIKINMFFRKVLVYMEIFSEGFKERAFDEILKTCHCKTNEISSQQTQSDSINEEIYLSIELNEVMLTEFAETISRMTIAVDQSLNEKLMYQLYDCNIAAIQKSAFILLKHYYEKFAVKLSFEIQQEQLEEDKEYVNKLLANTEFVPVDMGAYIQEYHHKEREFLQKEEDVMEEEEDVEDLGEKYLLGFKNQGFLLTWISLLLKLKLQVSNSSSALENVYKRAFVNYFNQRGEVYTGLLDTVFSWLRTLNLNLAQQKEIVKGREYELSSCSIEWEDFSSYEGLFRLILQFLYLFIAKFPKYFGKWYNATLKPNQKEVESLLRNFISNTLFNDEKKLIENKQGEWKTEEFNIYVMGSTREIFASYMKENSKLEISIQVPVDYPIIPIDIECKKGVKIPEAKLKKYTLMMRTILVNENNTFLAALMLWKNNIEKEFEGVEECAICYYVVHSSTKDLPKLACKTCKHKFHSVCIHKWFDSSNKSECPLCKSQFW